jgi:tetratricopeptide (TPR) repeat protein
VRLEKAESMKFYKKPWTRVIAGILAVAMLSLLLANSLVVVRIKADSSTEAATNYLVDNTQYVHSDTLDRLQEKFRNLSEPTSLEDHYRMASIQIAEENYKGALTSIEQCIKQEDGSDRKLHQDLLLKQGCLLVLLERYSEALVPLDQVLLEAPDTLDALLVKAQIYATQQDIENLIRTLEQYLEIESDNLEIRHLLAQTLFSTEDYAGAEEQYRTILESEDELSDPSEYHYLYGLTCIQLSDFSTAQEHLIQALNSGKSYEGIHYYIGLCCMSNGAYAEAIEYLDTSIENESMLQLSHYSRGVSGLMTENYDTKTVLGDLAFAAEYVGSDADETIASQAAQLLQQLEGSN